MSEPTSDEGLSELLDNALGDFGKFEQKPVPRRTTDDDLDDFLTPMDAAATQKAAENFEKMLKEIAEPKALEQVGSAESPQSGAESADGTHFLSELLGINKLLDQDGADPEIRALTETLLKTCFTKDVIHPMTVQFRDAIADYMADEGNVIDEQERRNLAGQHEGDTPTTADTAEQNALWAKLRDYGEVPAAIIEKFEKQMPPGLGALGGFPGMPNMGGDEQQCTLM